MWVGVERSELKFFKLVSLLQSWRLLFNNLLHHWPILSINNADDEIWFAQSDSIDCRKDVGRSVAKGQKSDAGNVLREAERFRNHEQSWTQKVGGRHSGGHKQRQEPKDLAAAARV